MFNLAMVHGISTHYKSNNLIQIKEGFNFPMDSSHAEVIFVTGVGVGFPPQCLL